MNPRKEAHRVACQIAAQHPLTDWVRVEGLGVRLTLATLRHHNAILELRWEEMGCGFIMRSGNEHLCFKALWFSPLTRVFNRLHALQRKENIDTEKAAERKVLQRIEAAARISRDMNAKGGVSVAETKGGELTLKGTNS